MPEDHEIGFCAGLVVISQCGMHMYVSLSLIMSVTRALCLVVALCFKGRLVPVLAFILWNTIDNVPCGAY